MPRVCADLLPYRRYSADLLTSAPGTEQPVRLGLALCRMVLEQIELIQTSICSERLQALFQAIQSFFEVMALLLNIFQRF